MEQPFSFFKAFLVLLLLVIISEDLKAQPANDLCENAQVIPVSDILNECSIVNGTTQGANDELGAFECSLSEGPYPDVYFIFNSGNYITLYIDVSLITQTDLLMSVSELCGEGEVISCITNQNENGGVAYITYEDGITKNTDYIVRISTNSGIEATGEFDICVVGYHLCYNYDTNQGADPGDPCQIYMGAEGIFNEMCECVCPPEGCECFSPCYGELVAPPVTLNGTDEVITSSAYFKQCQSFQNTFAGNQYTITAEEGDGNPAYIYVYGPVQGYSPITVTATLDGSFGAKYFFNSQCQASLSPGPSLEITVQCITCDYDCPNIPGYFGDPCDDEDSSTLNDVLDSDCNCSGVAAESGYLSGTADWNSSCGEMGMTIRALYAWNIDLSLFLRYLP